MFSNFITPHIRFSALYGLRYHSWQRHSSIPRLCCPQKSLPKFVRQCRITMQARSWLTMLPWSKFPQRTLKTVYPYQPVPFHAYVGAFLVKLDQQLPTIAALRRYLVDHPALVWGLGFPLQPAPTRYGFEANDCLPTRQHFARVLRQLPNDVLQTWMDAQVHQLQTQMPSSFGRTISLDTKHIIAWVKENNPRVFIKEGRFDSARQPAGDPDCKVGCKRRQNQKIKTPKSEGEPAGKLVIPPGEFYWGYASGVVATKVPDLGEFVLAEITNTFDHGDTRYFFPLMAQVEQRLGFRPKYGALDAAYDAFYVYEYFYNSTHDGFAAVPLNQPNGKCRSFSKEGLPLCQAGLAMPIRKTYMDRTKAIIPHQRSFYACPLFYPTTSGADCPVEHKQWSKGGCSVQMPVSIGARLRHQLNRKSDRYLTVYSQRTAVERLFSQAKALGIERPKLRNQQAITNQNTLIYLLINARGLKRALMRQNKN